MIKSALIIIILAMFAAIVLTACKSKKEEDDETCTDYIITTELPTEARPYVKDPVNPKYVKIWPHFDASILPKEKGKIKWFSTGLGSQIPAFPEGKLMEVINTDKDFAAYIANVDEKMFQEYTEKLMANGYKYYEEKSWESLSMYNDKYEINLRFSQDGNNLTLIRAIILADEENNGEGNQ